MKGIKFILLSICATGFLSCQEDKNLQQGRVAYLRFYENNLPNPKSLVVDKETYTIGKRHEVKWVVEISTESIYGVMTTKKDSFVTLGDRVFKFNEMLLHDDGSMNRKY